MGTSMILTPSLFARSKASSDDSRDVNREGMKTHTMLSLPSASAARAATSAESIPPESPITVPLNPFFFT
ncbi:MAG: hypothetical protein A4E61_00111 [Syntrophorhabdus sp. PtaB.Bin184]|nr:MAG: hypothetical protein A4E61_00111 [Syntrophorhabdus sp. PtaB.Bin184]